MHFCADLSEQEVRFEYPLGPGGHHIGPCALNRQTHHMIRKEEIELMKPGAYIINTSRGAVVKEAALIEALQQSRISGSGLDVFENRATAGR